MEMPLDKNDCLELVYETIDDINETMADRKLVKAPHTQLFGCSGNLDSIGLVTFIVMLEQKLANQFGRPFTIAEDRALSRDRSPFLTVESLAEYLTEQLNDQEAI
jgi:acyl carrier protein